MIWITGGPCILGWIDAVFWAFVQALAVAAISFVAGQFLKNVKSTAGKPKGKDAFTLPTNEQERMYPVVFGERYVDGPNAITPILELDSDSIDRWANKWTNNHYKIGYRYYLTFVMGVCQGNIDGVTQIMVGDTYVWPTLDSETDIESDGQTTVTIDAGKCWGGTDSMGGVKGEVHIGYGGETATVDAYLSALDTPPTLIPYKGLTVAILCHVYIGTQAVVRAWSFLCKRTQHLSDGAAMWYIAKAELSRAQTTGDDHRDLNAVHVLYELVTSSRIGLGKSTSLIGDTFEDVADVCYDEGYGLSCVWDWKADEIDDMIEQVEQIIDGKLLVDLDTSQYEVVLRRDDYTVGELEEFDESDFWVESESCFSLGTIPSRTICYWWDRIAKKTCPAYACDVAILYKQGGQPITQELDYSGFICDETLAATVASREQMHVSAMAKVLVLRCLRTMAHLQEQDVFKISYPSLNITSMVVRVVSIDRGEMEDQECTINVCEDVFGAVYTTYGTAPSGPATEEAEESYTLIIVDEGYSEITYETEMASEVMPSPSASPSSSASA